MFLAFAGELVFLKQAANDIVDAFELENTEGRIRMGMLRFRGSFSPME